MAEVNRKPGRWMVGAGVHTAPQGTSCSYKPQGNPEPEHEGQGDPHAPQAQSLRGLKNSVIEINTIQHSWYPEILDQDSNPSHSGENTRPLTARPQGAPSVPCLNTCLRRCGQTGTLCPVGGNLKRCSRWGELHGVSSTNEKRCYQKIQQLRFRV